MDRTRSRRPGIRRPSPEVQLEEGEADVPSSAKREPAEVQVRQREEEGVREDESKSNGVDCFQRCMMHALHI